MHGFFQRRGHIVLMWSSFIRKLEKDNLTAKIRLVWTPGNDNITTTTTTAALTISNNNNNNSISNSDSTFWTHSLDAFFGHTFLHTLFGHILWTNVLDTLSGYILWTHSSDTLFGHSVWTHSLTHSLTQSLIWTQFLDRLLGHSL